MVSVSALVGVGAAVEIGIDCVDARVKCAYRVGCGMALRNYIVGCSTVLQGPYVDYCPEVCQHALIALTSTPEGEELMTVSKIFDFKYFLNLKNYDETFEMKVLKCKF